MHKPEIIKFQEIGKDDIGYLSIAEVERSIPFELKRVFWTYHTPDNIVRGRHAHYKTEMILIAVSGTIVVNTESPTGDLQTYKLMNPSEGLFIPKLYWHTMQYTDNAVQLVLCSTLYSEEDYIRDYKVFSNLKNQRS